MIPGNGTGHAEKGKGLWDTREIRDSEFGPISVVSKKGLITLKAFRNNGRDREEIRVLEGRHDES